jgi:cytochrome P450
MNEMSSPPPLPQDERRSASVAERNVDIPQAARRVQDFALARALLRSPVTVQDIELTGEIPGAGSDQVPVIFLDGEEHRRRRANLARFFSPKAIKEHHLAVMEATTAALIAQLRQDGRGQLDLMSMQLACDVAAAIVGLTDSNPEAMARRIRMTFESTDFDSRKGWRKLVHSARMAYKSLTFFWLDVKPAIRARRAKPRADIISHLIEQGYSDKAILIDCLTYATAGMLTTREFIVMVAWYMFDRPELRDQFLAADEAGQIEILEEIIRLEPVAAFVFRKASQDMAGPDGTTIRAGERFALDIRAANTDAAVAGECPFGFDAERGRRQKVPGGWLSFGDGAHRCPGAQVALGETRVFIDALLRVPGIRLETPPSVGWCHPIAGYELHGAIVVCERG